MDHCRLHVSRRHAKRQTYILSLMGPASGLFIGSDDAGPVDNAGLGACTGHRFTPLTRTHREPNRQGSERLDFILFGGRKTYVTF